MVRLSTPDVIANAMRLGILALMRPVITCTDSGGPTELVSDGANGFVVEPEPEAIARAVDRLWAERGLARRLGRAAFKRGVKVNWHHVIGELTA